MKTSLLNNRQFRRLLLLLLDVAAVAASITVAFVLRFEGAIPTQYIAQLPRVILLFAALRLAVFYALGFYRQLWRYASIPELVVITGGALAGSILLFGFEQLTGLFIVPKSIYLIDFLLVLFSVGFIRFAIRARRHLNAVSQAATGRRILIYGAGEAGVGLLADFQRQPGHGVQVIGLVDDDPTKVRGAIHGVPVLGEGTDLQALTRQHKIDEIIIAMPAAPKAVVQRVVKDCQQTKTKLMILPPLNEILNGRVRAQDVRAVALEDLLGREPVTTDLAAISSYLAGRRILVTGAGGSIGSELCRQICSFGPAQLLLLDHGENSLFDVMHELEPRYPKLSLESLIADIRDGEKIDRLFAHYRPQVVFHAAAHKHVPFMEAHPDEAVLNNVFGTRNVAVAAHRNGAERFVFISTDKAVNPANVMGATKRVAEMWIQSLADCSVTKFVAVRFGNVLGSRGSAVPLFKKQIAQGGPVTVTHPDMRRYFMTIPEAVQLIIHAGAIGAGGELFVLDMGEPVKVVDLARSLIRLSGYEPDQDIEIVFTGVRPGEKLFEELINSSETIAHRWHEKIVQLAGTAPAQADITAALGRLADHLGRHDLMELTKELYRIVGTEPVVPAGLAADSKPAVPTSPALYPAPSPDTRPTPDTVPSVDTRLTTGYDEVAAAEQRP